MNALLDPKNADYFAFIKAKVCQAQTFGWEIDDSEIHPLLMPHQRAAVRWAIRGGRRALFESFGLGKSVQQLEIVRIVRARVQGRGLIVCPLGVRQEFVRDAAMLGTPVKFIRSIEEADPDPAVLCLTNYETVRDGKLDPKHFSVVSLDEAAILRGFGGTATFRELMAIFAGDDRRATGTAKGPAGVGVPYRFVATATPSPNEYIELLAYAAYLGIMDISAAKTRWFKRDSEKADNLTLHPHKEKEFWLWVASWALFISTPSDVDPSFSDEGYTLPPLDVRWHELRSDHERAGVESDGQVRLYKDAALGVTQASREKRDSLTSRVEKMAEIVNESPDDHFILWHDLEDERRAIKAALPEAVEVYGSQDLEEREQRVIDFAEGRSRLIATKPSLSGAGCNLQRHCHRAIFVGVGFQFHSFVQAVHRIQRFLQDKPVRIDLIHTEAERRVVETLKRKWAQHEEMVKKMTQIIREHGLAGMDMALVLSRALGVERVEVSAPDGSYQLVNNDCVPETREMASNSVGLVLTSVPFSTQYEYSPNYSDFGHSDDNAHFFKQMDFLTPELLRVVEPGRLAIIHVKDRVVPAGMTGDGCQSVYPFHMRLTEHFTRCPECRPRIAVGEIDRCPHWFSYGGMKTIITDVVRENNQTYRLGWSEQCKDATKMGVGMSEYLLIFRKPPTDSVNLYADRPVEKSKLDYTLSRWQVDAHGFTRSSGNRRLKPEDFDGLDHAQIFRLFRDWNLANVYDFDFHVAVGEALAAREMLPTKFMLLQPPSWSPDVLTDVARMRTLNTSQVVKGKEQHLCPLPLDLVDRIVEQYSMKGDVVYDPFGGLLTVAERSIRLGRKAITCELSVPYFRDGVAYCQTAWQDVNMPSLFDLPELAGDVAAGESRG